MKIVPFDLLHSKMRNESGRQKMSVRSTVRVNWGKSKQKYNLWHPVNKESAGTFFVKDSPC